jgi:hypothetical protein
MIDIEISGPEILIPFDRTGRCRFCNLPETLEPQALMNHYISAHEYPVIADYFFQDVRCVELDKHGQRSDRSNRCA